MFPLSFEQGDQKVLVDLCYALLLYALFFKVNNPSYF